MCTLLFFISTSKQIQKPRAHRSWLEQLCWLNKPTTCVETTPQTLLPSRLGHCCPTWCQQLLTGSVKHGLKTKQRLTKTYFPFLGTGLMPWRKSLIAQVSARVDNILHTQQDSLWVFCRCCWAAPGHRTSAEMSWTGIYGNRDQSTHSVISKRCACLCACVQIAENRKHKHVQQIDKDGRKRECEEEGERERSVDGKAEWGERGWVLPVKY